MVLKPAEHQVAGHRAGEGSLGPLVDDSGRFFKPLQDQQRFSQEFSFYESLYANPKIPKTTLRFFPLFYGTRLLEASDGSGQHQHLVIEDLLSGIPNPSVMDVKIGSKTWYPDCSQGYFTKCFDKDKGSTSLRLGFRLSGLQVHVNEQSGFWKPSKKWVQGILTVEQVRSALRAFVSSNPSESGELDCTYALDVYGSILPQLTELKEWIEKQTFYHFFSASVLLMYGRDGSEASAATVKLIDFAHVIDGGGVIDHNFLGGLCSLMKFLEDVVESAKESMCCSEKK